MKTLDSWRNQGFTRHSDCEFKWSCFFFMSSDVHKKGTKSISIENNPLAICTSSLIYVDFYFFYGLQYFNFKNDIRDLCIFEGLRNVFHNNFLIKLKFTENF